MNIAEQIKAYYSEFSPSLGYYIVPVTAFSELIEEAEEKAIDTEQDWDNESTMFVFVDKSCLVIQNQTVSTYGTVG